MALQLTFYKPDPKSPTVVDNNGNYVSKADYLRITGQTGVPDSQINWSYVQNGPPPVQQQAPAPTPAPVQQPVQQQPQQQQGLTGVPELDATYNRLQQYVTDLQAQGKTINPNIELTPATVQQFLDQAKGEIEPYYAQQIGSMKNELKSSLDVLQRQYDLSKQGQEAQFKQSLNQTRERLADSGAAYSGFRGQQEKQLREGTQRSLESLGLGAASSASGALYGGAQTLGSRNISDLAGAGSFGVPTASTGGAGGFTTGSTRSFYNPTDITGSIQYAQNADVRQLQDFLKSQEVAKRSLSFTGA